MKPTTEIAERLAANFLGDSQKNRLNDLFIESILRRIPLLELLEVARLAQISLDDIEEESRFPEQNALQEALSTLKARIPEL